MVKSIAVGSLINVIRPTYLYSTSDMSFTSDRGVWILSPELVIILQKAHMKEKADREYVAEIITACGINGWVWFQNIDEV